MQEPRAAIYGRRKIRVTSLSILNPIRDETGKVIEFTIDRRFWGVGAEGGSLLDGHTGKMCCMGHYSRACGLPLKKIESAGGYVTGLGRNNIPKQLKWLVDSEYPAANSAVADELANINDATKSNTKTRRRDFNRRREEKIIRRFARQGITVNFVN